MEPTDRLQMLGAILVGALLVSAGVGVAQMDGDPAGPAAANPGQVEDPGAANRTITVSATGTATTEPDQAVVRLSVQSVAADPTVARTNVAENVSRLRSALTEMGLESSQIRTQDFNLYRDDHPGRAREGDGDGPVYRARHGLVIEVADIDRVGAVIDTAIDNGASSIHDVRFTVSEDTREELRQEALAEAMNKSRTRADTLAGSADLQVTGAQTVTTASTVRPYRAEATMAGGDAGGSTDISSGPVGVTVSVQVTYGATEAN